MARIIKTNMDAKSTDSARNREIRYIVVHYTAGTTSKPGYAENIAAFFSRPDSSQSSDFIIDDETIVEFNPDIKNRYSWHCGGSKLDKSGGSLYGECTNENSIGIEISSTNRSGSITFPGDTNYYFTEAVLKNASNLIRNLMAEYNIDISHVIRHFDVNGKKCPGVPGWYGSTESSCKWIEFKNSLELKKENK